MTIPGYKHIPILVLSCAKSIAQCTLAGWNKAHVFKKHLPVNSSVNNSINFRGTKHDDEVVLHGYLHAVLATDVSWGCKAACRERRFFVLPVL